MELLELLFSVLLLSGLLFFMFSFIVGICYFSIAIGKAGLSSRQATDYWREKFKDETVLHTQQETLLRASRDTEPPEVLLHAAEEQETHPEQLVRAVMP